VVWQGGHALEEASLHPLINTGPARAVHPRPRTLDRLGVGCRIVHSGGSGLFLSLESLPLALVDGGQVDIHCFVGNQVSNTVALMSHNPILPRGALGPGLKKDIIVEIIGSALGDTRLLEMHLGEMAPNHLVVHCPEVTLATSVTLIQLEARVRWHSIRARRGCCRLPKTYM
jgi:hypothetical protein